MSQEPKDPFRETHLDSAEYRDRLMRKLNCLIAVLEVANAKVKRSLTGPEPDVDRLTKIQTNLTSTLEVCRRARRALEKRESLPRDLPETLSDVVRRNRLTARAPGLPKGARFEMSSPDEHKRFADMGKITGEEIGTCDLDALSRQLLG